MTENSPTSRQAIVRSMLHRAGFATLTQFVKSHEADSFDDMAQELGDAIPSIQFEKMLRDEVRSSEDLQYFARISLIKHLIRKCPGGWKATKDFDLTLALSAWGGSLDRRYESTCNRIIQRLLRRQDLPSTWLPRSASDPVIQEIFDGESFDMESS